MALSTYGELVASIGSWLNRRDLDDRIPDFLQLCEADLALKLRDRRMHTRVDATVGSSPIELPDDWLEAVRIVPHGKRPLVGAPHALMSELGARRGAYGGYVATGVADQTSFYVVTGNTLELHPTPAADTVLDMVYFARLPALTADAPTNWLLQADPGLYLYGSLVQAEPYLANDERVATWAAMYRDRLDNRNAASAAAEISGGPLRRMRRGFG